MEMTKEEFGLDLFEAIKCCGEILQLRRSREKTPPARIKPGQLTAWQHREQEITDHLRALSARLPDADLAEMVRRYPFMQGI